MAVKVKLLLELTSTIDLSALLTVIESAFGYISSPNKQNIQVKRYLTTPQKRQ